MNKKKSLLLVILSFVMAFALVFSFGCKPNTEEPEDPATSNDPDDKLLAGNYEGAADVEDEPADGWVLQEITLNLDGVKTEYEFGEEYDSSTKPVVTAKYASVESLIKYEETKLLLEGVAEIVYDTKTVTDVKIDAGQYNKDAVGTYRIYVSYSHAGVTRSTYYEVTVKGISPDVGGLTVELDTSHDHYDEESGSLVYYIGGVEGVDVDITGGFHVYPIDKDLEKGEEILAATDDAEGYTVTYYQGGTKIDNLNGLQKGDYSVYVTYNHTTVFFVISVLDPVDSIVLKEGTTEQEQGPEEVMTDTWVFTVTYRSGLTAEVRKGTDGLNAGLLIPGIVPVKSGSYSATVVYQEGNDQGSVPVPYTITAKEGVQEVSDAYDYTLLRDIVESGKDRTIDKTELTGANAFLKKGENDNVVLNFRRSQDGNLNGTGMGGVLEIRYDALKVEFYGFGMLKLSVRGNGASNTSCIALKDEDGNYVSAIFNKEVDQTGKVLIKEGTTANGKAYLVTGDVQKADNGEGGTTNLYAARDLTFVITKPGVYTITTLNALTADGEATETATGRPVRVYQIEKTDVYDSSADRVSYEFAINTDNVVKDYVAKEGNVVDKTNLTATFTEVHSDEDVDDVETPLTADQLTATFVNCDWTKTGYGTTGKVEVTYEAGGVEYKDSYVINILSPIEIGEEGSKVRVNTVKITKDTTNYSLPDEDTTTIAIANDDIKFYANNSNTEITGTTDIKLYDGEEALDSWTVGAGTYKVVATIVVAHTENEGSTEFSREFNITVEAYTPSGEAKNYEGFFLEELTDVSEFSKVTYGKDTNITKNTLFTITATAENGLLTSVAKKSSSEGGGDTLISGLSYTKADETTYAPTQGIKLPANGHVADWFTVKANEHITLRIYVAYANDSFNSNKVGTLVYTLNGSSETKDVANRYNDAWTVEIRLNKDEVVAFKTTGSNTDGKGWLFGAEAKKEDEAAPRAQTYTATFHINNEAITTLTAPEAQIIPENGKVTEPDAFEAVSGWTFGGWYTSATPAEGDEAYDFDTTVTADVDLYAKWTQSTTATVTFDANGHGTAPAAQELNIGDKATYVTLKAQGYKFGGWYTSATPAEGDEAFDFDTAVTGNVDLYAKWIEIDTTVQQTYTYTYGDIEEKADNGALTDNDLIKNNEFLTKYNGDGAVLNYRTSNNAIEIKNDALSVTFAGAGTLTITVSSTGGSNWSAIIVKKLGGDGNVAATYTAGTNIEATENKEYCVLGTGAQTFTFNITEAGTYIIGTVNVTIPSDSAKNTGRNTRIRGLVMVDNGTAVLSGKSEVEE